MASEVPMAAPCHLCGQAALEELPAYAALRRVSSDCRPWPAGGQLGVCRACGGVQKVIDAAWLAEIEAIYAHYAIYHQSGGVEQAVFTAGSDQAQPRSLRLLQCLAAHRGLPAAGRWLDLGCGNGALLRVVSEHYPGWTLAGQEINSHYQAVVEAIPRVEALHTCAPDHIPGAYDMVSLIHVLEHIPNPEAYARPLGAKLLPSGRLVVEVPNHAQNPFDLLIADHATHFTAATLAAVLRRAGYADVMVAADWVPKELTAVAAGAAGAAGAAADPAQARRTAARHLAWLEAVRDQARGLAGRRPFGLFGTSIAATWLFSEVDAQVDFFIDEDPARRGKTHLGRPIFAPADAPPESTVLLALPAPLAQKLQARLSPERVTWVAPVPFPDGDEARRKEPLQS